MTSNILYQYVLYCYWNNFDFDEFISQHNLTTSFLLTFFDIRGIEGIFRSISLSLLQNCLLCRHSSPMGRLQTSHKPRGRPLRTYIFSEGIEIFSKGFSLTSSSGPNEPLLHTSSPKHIVHIDSGTREQKNRIFKLWGKIVAIIRGKVSREHLSNIFSDHLCK